jgi:hypothetical protein
LFNHKKDISAPFHEMTENAGGVIDPKNHNFDFYGMKTPPPSTGFQTVGSEPRQLCKSRSSASGSKIGRKGGTAAHRSCRRFRGNHHRQNI